MKKLILLILTISTLTLVACNGNNSSSGEKSLDVVALATALTEQVKFEDQLTLMDTTLLLPLFDIDDALLSNSAVYISTGATAEEVAVFEAVDDKSAKAVNESVLARINTQKAGFESYVPAEIKKLDEAILIQSGVYVIMCVTSDVDNASKIIEEHLK